MNQEYLKMMKRSVLVLSLLLCSVYMVHAEMRFTYVNTTNYNLGNNEVIYTEFDLGSYIHENPVTVTINPAVSTGTVGLCVSANPDYFISGANLADGCPVGAYAPFSSSNSSIQLSLPVVGMSALTIASMNNATGNYTFSFQFNYCSQDIYNCTANNATYCVSYPVNGMCANSVPVIDLKIEGSNSTGQSIPFSAPAMGWYFAELVVPSWANYLNVTPEFATVTAYLQQGYLPSKEWYLEVYTSENDDSQTTSTVFTPAYISSSQTYFVGLYNPSSISIYSSFNVSLTNCKTQGKFGPYCSYNSSSIVQLNGTSNGTVVTKDLTDSDYNGEYEYFVLKSSAVGNSSYIRVSVGNQVIDYTEENTLAPPLFAKLEGYPSAQSYDYMSNGSLANQMVLPLMDSADWYFAVPLPNDFTIWTVENCANDCSGSGSCTTYGNLGDLPTKTTDVAGECSCYDDDYDQSFNCSEKTNSNSPLYIVLIAIGGAIVLAVAIGVPVYCYFQNKRRSRFNQGYDALVDETPQ